ncbi:MAG: hypothetical protein AAF591_16830 [Verrucomicrobiota bacterium]
MEEKEQSNMGRRAQLIILGVYLGSVAALMVVLDRFAAVSLDGRFVAIAAGFGLVPVFAVLSGTGDLRHLILAGVFLMFLVVLPFVELSPVKPYKKFFLSVRPGMSQEEILEELVDRFPEGGRYTQPTWANVEDGTLRFWLDLTDGRYNAEIIRVTFWEGRSIATMYMGD